MQWIVKFARSNDRRDMKKRVLKDNTTDTIDDNFAKKSNSKTSLIADSSGDLGSLLNNESSFELKTNNVDTNIILDRIKVILNIKTDFELSKYLGISSNTIYSWKSRNSVDVWTLFQKLPKLDWNYIFYGEGFDKVINENESRNQELIQTRRENAKLKEDLVDLRKVLVNLSTILAGKD